MHHAGLRSASHLCVNKWLMRAQVAIAFGLLLPLNIVLAQNFRDFTPTWFHLHCVLGTVAWISGGCLTKLD